MHEIYSRDKLKGVYFYNYTSLDALKGIIENKEIWLNNILYSNDKLEIKYFFNIDSLLSNHNKNILLY